MADSLAPGSAAAPGPGVSPEPASGPGAPPGPGAPAGFAPGSRRDFLRQGLRGAALLTLGLGAGRLFTQPAQAATVWQIDPYRCTQCGKCATHCVLSPSAVKCVHAYEMCGYCELCTAFFEPEPNALSAGAENQLCPTGAILRTFVEDPYFEYRIDEARCVGCAKCVRGCTAFGNGSMHLQIRQDRCLNCNECAISAACPAGAFRRVPAAHPYLMKGKGEKGYAP